MIVFGTIAVANQSIAPTNNIVSGDSLPLLGENTLIPRSSTTLIGLQEWEFRRVLNMVIASDDNYIGLTEIVYDLAKCESGFNEKRCIIDTNNKLSCGLFQYQKTTWEHFCEGKYEEMTMKKQIECATKMLSKGLWKHWYNCSISQNLANKI